MAGNLENIESLLHAVVKIQTIQLLLISEKSKDPELGGIVMDTMKRINELLEKLYG